MKLVYPNFFEVGFFLCVATHPIHKGSPFLAFVVAVFTMLLVGHWVHTLTFAAYLWVLAFLPTPLKIKSVCPHIHTFLLATFWPWAALSMANPTVLVTCHHDLGALSKKVTCSLKRNWFLGFRESRLFCFVALSHH